MVILLEEVGKRLFECLPECIRRQVFAGRHWQEGNTLAGQSGIRIIPDGSSCFG
jgi:hypothetical protein